MEAALIVFCFFLGKCFSLLLYRFCWEIHLEKTSKWTLTALAIPLLFAFVALLFSGWNEQPLTRIFASVTAFQLAVAAIGRFDPSRPCFFGNLAIFILSLAVYWHPSFFLASVFFTCLLHYRQAGWALNPGYSNLLGFEFSRSSACSVVAALVAVGFTECKSQDVLILSVLLLHQSSYYINHALAKCALGRHWCDWMNQNRIQYLLSNSWLRGWTLGFSKEKWLFLHRKVAAHRVLFCWAGWSLEASWLLVFLHPQCTMLLYIGTLFFHLSILLLTGLSCWHFVINHLCILFFLSQSFAAYSSPQMTFFAICSCFLAAAYVGLVRFKHLKAHQSDQKTSPWKKFADALDHLMAWWDSPFMRMYSYTVETESGACFSLPVTRFSPHDTALTDIHTHLMILNLHEGLEPHLEKDKTYARSGVWGLLVDEEEKNKFYAAQQPVFEKKKQQALIIQPESNHLTNCLFQHVEALNRCMSHPFYRYFLTYPHFPGEDHVPDSCPLVKNKLPVFQMNEPIKILRLWCLKTWISEDDFTLLEHSLCVEIQLKK